MGADKSTVIGSFALAAMAMLALPASAQQVSQKNGDDTITVTGQIPEKGETRKEAREFVGKTMTSQFGQYARRNTPLCPKIVGIAQNYSDIMIAKIKAIAQASGVPLTEGKCTPNLHILFTGDGNALMAKLAKVRPSSLDQVALSDRDTIMNRPVPVRWWYTSELRGTDGQPPASRTIGPFENLLSLKSFSASQVDTQIRIDLTGTVVVVDVNQATGYPLESIAAFAAMVSFAEFKPARDYSEFPSILAMFTSGREVANSPRDLTAWDLAFVSALYKTPPNRDGNVQKAQIATKMAVTLTE